ncbi:hypothetical protein VNO77_44067 [Canavalia gladiata]|uniref:Uncharacterized protein n=1 Tax=Canavalia gladiata TaxID=3824 RepID=A0AAN9JVC7_CANGL
MKWVTLGCGPVEIDDSFPNTAKSFQQSNSTSREGDQGGFEGVSVIPVQLQPILEPVMKVLIIRLYGL